MVIVAVILGVITPNLFISIICYAFSSADHEIGPSDASATVRKLRALFDRIDGAIAVMKSDFFAHVKFRIDFFHADDRSGQIETAEMRQLALNLGVSLTVVELQTATEEMDYDGGGNVDFDEFCEWWRSESPIAERLKRGTISCPDVYPGQCCSG